LTWHAAFGAATAAGATGLLLTPAVSRTVNALAPDEPAGDPTRTTTEIVTVLAVVLPCLLLLVALFRPALRRPLSIIVASLVWAVLAYRLEPLSFDVALVAVVTAVALIPRARQVVSGHSLVMLTLMASVLVYVNVLAVAIPGSLRALLAPIAFVTPVLAQFTLDAKALNHPPDGRSARILVALGVSLVGLGLVLVYELTSGRDEFLDWLVDGSFGLVAIPFAIALAAMSGATGNRRLKPPSP
jgi:hypothetical protein